MLAACNPAGNAEDAPSLRWRGAEVPLVHTPYGALPSVCVRQHGDDLLRLEEGVAVYVNGSRQPPEPADVAFCAGHDLKEALGFSRGPGWRRAAAYQRDTFPITTELASPGASGPLPAATYYQGAVAVVGSACNHTQLDTWTAVYSLPDHDPSHGTIDFWLGVEPVSTEYDKDGRCNGHAPGANLTVLQPVVSWFEHKWGAAAWNCCPEDQVHVGNRFHLERPCPDVEVSIRRQTQGAAEVFTVHMDAGFGNGKSTLAMMANGRRFGWFMAVQENHQLNESGGCSQLLEPGDRFAFKRSALTLVGSAHPVVPNFTVREPWHSGSPLAAKCGGHVNVSYDQARGPISSFSIDVHGPPGLAPPQPAAPLSLQCLKQMRSLCSLSIGAESCEACAASHQNELTGCNKDDTARICLRGLQVRVNISIAPTQVTDRMVISVTRAENSTYEDVAVLGLSGNDTGQWKCFDVSDRANDNYFVAGTRFGHYFGGAVAFKSALLQLRATAANSTDLSLSVARWSSAVEEDENSFSGHDGVRTQYPGNISRCDTWPACQAVGRDTDQTQLQVGERLSVGEFALIFNGQCNAEQAGQVE